MEIMIVNAQQQVKKVTLEWGGNLKVESGDSIRLANKIDMKTLRKGNDLILQNGKGQEFVMKDFYLKGKKAENQLLSWDDELDQEREISSADSSNSTAVASEDTAAANNSAAADQSAEAGAAKSQDSGKAAGWMTTENGEPGALPVLGGILALGAIALTASGGGGSSGSGSPINGNLTPAQLALQKIVDYANNPSNPAPTVEDYATAGVTGVTATTLPVVNPAVDAKVGADVDTVAELQAVIDAAIAAQTAALQKIVDYANNNTNPAPTVADYTAAGVSGVTDATLPTINAAVDAKVGADVDTVPELQGVIDTALVAKAALDKIVAYANDNTNPAPTVADYTAAGITGVTATTLPAVNPAVDAKVGTDVDTVAELQAVVDAAVVAQTAAMNKIVAYANDNTNPAPTVADYIAAGATGVTATTLPAVNPAIDAKVGADVDTLAELQAVINAALAAQTAALDKIVAYADDNTNPAPTVADYTAAGITGVTATTLPAVNPAVDAKVGTDVDTVAELQALVDAALAAQTAAMNKIVAYANDNSNPAPTVADYIAAGAVGVDATTLPAVNPAIDAKVGTDVDTLAELQAVIDAALAAQTTALDKIVAYANDNTNPAPTVADYTAAGITGVTATTLPAVNPAVDAKVGTDVDTVAELQALVDATLAAQTAAMNKIVAYANDNTNPAPTVTDYIAAGATGVDATTLPAVNPAVDAVTGLEVDTLPELQAVIDAALAAQTTALQKIVDYANDNTNPEPTITDYIAAGATGVDATTLPAVNPAVDAKVGTDVDTLAELQAVINAALAAQATALAKIVAYAENETLNPAPTVADYAAAGAVGVDATTLPLVDPAIIAVTGVDVDTLPELQAVINAALEDLLAQLALQKIIDYANDNTKPIPTVEDYANAGVSGVTAANLATVNPAVDAVTGAEVDTVPELQALVDAALATKTAMDKIVAYANDSVNNPAPTVEDYAAAGATGVTATTLPAVNPAVDAVSGVDVDTLPELQAVIDTALAAQATALAKIVAYANNNTNPIPTVADYVAAGATGVNATTLASVNPAVDAVTGLEVDTLPELQAVIDAALATFGLPAATLSQYSYDKNTDTLTLIGTKWNTILEVGEDPTTTDVSGRLNWDKLSWDWGGNNLLGSPAAGEAFSESHIQSAFVNATGTSLTVKLTAARASALEVTSNILNNTIDMQADFVKDGAGNVGTISKNDATTTLKMIDLGIYGNLINPVMVEGKLYYYWDRSGDGTKSNNDHYFDYDLNTEVSYGSKYTSDMVTMNQLESEFFGLSFGVVIDNDNRTWTMTDVNGNQITVRLPTYGSGTTAAGLGIDSGFQTGTGVDNTTYYQTTANSNTTYNDYLAIWDQFNGPYAAGSGKATSNPPAQIISGIPAGWAGGSGEVGYLSSTPASPTYFGTGGIIAVNLYNGNSGVINPDLARYVALEVVL